VLLPDAAALRETAELLDFAERSGHDFTLACARHVRGLTLVNHEGPQRAEGFELLEAARKTASQERYTMFSVVSIDTHLAKERVRVGDLDGAIELSRGAVEAELTCGDRFYEGLATAVLVEALLLQG
jgi:adenylate cyclase